jgi:hypothetical protein
MKGQEMKTLKQQWVDALRSGKYEKTKETLHDCNNGGFCALGVLAEIHPNIEYFEYGEKKGEDEWGEEMDLDEGYYYGETLLDGDLPKNILPMAAQCSVIDMNDDDKTENSFHEIAQWIEDNVDEVKL